MEVKSFMQINELLLKNKTISMYSLKFVMLGELGSRTLAEGLAKNTTVKVNLNILHFSHN